MIKKLIIAVGTIVIIASAFVMWKMLQPPPDDLDLRSERLSEQGLYSVTFTPEVGGPTTGPIHAWLVKVEDKNGSLVPGGTVSLDGGMPQHGHGLPTSPKMTGEISPGIYKIDGVKFSMSGWWEFKLKIDAGQGSDTITFNVVLE